MIRSFLAIEIPEDILRKIEKVQKDLKSSNADIKWVDPENIHITLKFFGNIEDSKIEPIIKTADKIIESYSPFSIKVRGVGSFPNLKTPRVIWIGVIDERGILSKFQDQLEKAFERLGFEAEKRPFHPHLTLGRMRSFKEKGDLIKRLERFQGDDFGEFKVEKVVLFKSELTRQGPIYTALEEVRLRS